MAAVDYIPADLTKSQTRQILRISEKYGIGSVFGGTDVNLPSFTLFKLVDLGYLALVRGRGAYDFYLTEKCQAIIAANN